MTCKHRAEAVGYRPRIKGGELTVWWCATCGAQGTSEHLGEPPKDWILPKLAEPATGRELELLRSILGSK